MTGEEAFRDSGSCDFGFCDAGSSVWVEVRAAASDDVFFGDVASGVGVVVGEPAVWCVETLGCTGPFSERAESPLVSARGLTIPVRPAQSNARTATAATETIPVRNGRRGR